MTAYVIVRGEVSDPEQYQKYREAVAPNIQAFGGEITARGAEIEVLEGSDDGRRLVIIEFPSREKAMIWWKSPEYAEVKPLRQGAATLDIILVEGA
jgi:uncharacterized protein (DUF1330 family)